jgi:orotidine-5'-phosphate decarboxylase
LNKDLHERTCMKFASALRARWRAVDSLLCVGLDPDPKRLPAHLPRETAVFDFCKGIVDATADYACCFKPQIAYFAALRAEDALEDLITHIHDAHPGLPVVLDAKRGDIGSTAEMYAREAFERYRADAVTINPYMGHDSAEPYLAHDDKGVIVLCRTSNPGGSDLQALQAAGVPVYQRVARMVSEHWNEHGNCALVVGATFPRELAEVRAIVGDMPLLVPGIGAQGGDIIATVAAGRDSAGFGMMINSSRAILYAGSGTEFAGSAREAARATRDAINVARAAHDTTSAS